MNLRASGAVSSISGGSASNLSSISVGAGSSSSTDELIAGSFGLPIVTKTTTYTAANDYTILGDATGGVFTVTLPTAASTLRRIYIVKKIDVSANAVTVKGNGAELIDAANTTVLSSQYSAIAVQSNGTQWFITGKV